MCTKLTSMVNISGFYLDKAPENSARIAQRLNLVHSEQKNAIKNVPEEPENPEPEHPQSALTEADTRDQSKELPEAPAEKPDDPTEENRESAEPAESNKAEIAAGSDIPVGHTEQTVPTEPTQPTESAESTEPVVPAEPAEPTETTEPAKPAESESAAATATSGEPIPDSGEAPQEDTATESEKPAAADTSINDSVLSEISNKNVWDVPEDKGSQEDKPQQPEGAEKSSGDLEEPLDDVDLE